MPGYGYIQEAKELDIDDNVIDTGVYKIDLRRAQERYLVHGNWQIPKLKTL